MNNYKKIIASFFLITIGSYSFAQSNMSKEDIKKYEDMTASVEGTYQIQVLNTRDQPFIPFNIGEIVINNRKQDEIFYYQLSDNVRIKILPINQVNSNEYKPLSQIEHIQE